jgi:hypothetical protein
MSISDWTTSSVKIMMPAGDNLALIAAMGGIEALAALLTYFKTDTTQSRYHILHQTPLTSIMKYLCIPATDKSHSASPTHQK